MTCYVTKGQWTLLAADLLLVSLSLSLVVVAVRRLFRPKPAAAPPAA